MPNDKISFENKGQIAKYLRKKGLIAAGIVNHDLRTASEGAFTKRFGPDFLKYVVDGDIERIKTLMGRYPGLVLYRFNAEDLFIGEEDSKSDVSRKTQKKLIIFKNYNAFELALQHLERDKLKDVCDALFSFECNDDMKQTIKACLERNLGHELLYHVIRGNQEATIEILKRYPKLIRYRGNITDYSGREFRDVTAFELAIWALDVRHMAPAMVTCLIESEEAKDYRTEFIQELQEQFDKVTQEGKGVNYSIGCAFINMSNAPDELGHGQTPEERYSELNRLVDRHNALIQSNDKLFYFHNLTCPKKLVEIIDPDSIRELKNLVNKNILGVDQFEIIHHQADLEIIQNLVADSRHIFKEKHYDFSYLIEMLEKSLSNFDRWSSKQVKAQWASEVGLAQHYLPAHVAQHYCNPNESFNPLNNGVPPRFEEEEFIRNLLYWNAKASVREKWWPVSVEGAFGRAYGPGLALGVLRGKSTIPFLISLVLVDETNCVASDLEALRVLSKVRTDDVQRLKQQLNALEQLDVEPINSAGL